MPPWHLSPFLLIFACISFHPLCVSAKPKPRNVIPNPTASLDNGHVIGTATTVPFSTVTVNQFLGIPFAKAPIRFSTPEAHGPWSSTLAATAQPPSCIQQFNDPPALRAFKERIYNFPPPPAGESEDCLFLDVYTPAPNSSQQEPKTVMVWFYGGNLQLGSDAIHMYDGTSFAANQDVVVVAPNYRTNVFGFPNNPQLALDERNLGFLDQRVALQWVQDNICEFGGDPSKVTIFGQSAGAASVDILITSMGNASDVPFRAGIMESGQAGLYITHNNSDFTAWNALSMALGCDRAPNVLKCVQAANSSHIKSILETEKLRFLPVADNKTMVEYPFRQRQAGRIAEVPIMLGTNANDGRYFTYNQTETLGFLEIFAPYVNETSWEEVITQYPIPSTGITNSFEQLSQIYTDFVFQCPASLVATYSREVEIPTWRYYFTAVFPNNQPFPDLGAFHSAEIPVVFGTYNTTGATEGQIRLSESMQTAWADFAKDPWAGPGWNQSSNVHVFASANEYDVPANDLDGKCELYMPLYASLLD